MVELVAIEGASQAEEILINTDFCNFSHISEHELDESALEIVWYSNVIVLPLIAFIGLSCNLLNMTILTSNKAAKRIPSWNLLLALAICDCLFLIFATLDVTPLSIPSLAFSITFNHYYTRIVLYIRTLASIFYKSSVLIVVAFNFERYICVVHPLRSHRLVTNRNSRNAILLALFISFLCSIQWPLAYNVNYCYEHNSEQYFYVILKSTNSALQIYYKIMDYVTLLGFNILPILALLYMNCRIIFTLRKVVDEDSRRDDEWKLSDGALVQQLPTYMSIKTENVHIKPSETEDEDYENRNNRTLHANAMLFAVAIMLFLCIGPQAPARILFDLYGQYHPRAILYTCLSQQLVFLNASLNFALYCVVSKRYRTLMKQTLKKLLHKLEVVDRPFQISLKQTKSTSAPVTSMEEHHAHLLIQPNINNNNV